MLKKGTKVNVIGVIEKVDSSDKVLPYHVRFNDDQLFWFGDDVCKPQKIEVAASSTSSNSDYKAAFFSLETALDSNNIEVVKKNIHEAIRRLHSAEKPPQNVL